MSTDAADKADRHPQAARLVHPVTLQFPAGGSAAPLSELLLLLLLVACAVAAPLLVQQRSVRQQFDMRELEPDLQTRFIGFHGLEQSGDRLYRWTGDYATFQVFGGYHVAPRYIAEMQLRSAEAQVPQPLTFRANERPLATAIPEQRPRNYRLLLPPAPPGETMLRFAVETPTFSPPGDERDLGVIVTGMGLTTLPFVNRAALLVVAIGLALLYLWARLRALPANMALLLVALFGAALALLWVRYPPTPLPFATRAAFALTGGLLAIAIARDTAGRIGLALLGLLVAFSGSLFPSWLSDDAFISFRYAQNLAQGHGLVYNIGERVEGYTNFLWTVLAGLVIRLGGDVVLWSYLSGIVLALAILLLVYRLGRSYAGPAVGLLAALLVATSQSLLIHTARGAGLETGLFTLLALGAGALYLRAGNSPRPTWLALAGLVFALATLTRPEGALLCALAAGHLYWTVDGEPFGYAQGRRWTVRLLAILRSNTRSVSTIHHPVSTVHRPPSIRPFIVLLGAYLLIVVPFFFWRYSYYGDLLPNTFYAKTGGGLRQLLRGFEYALAFSLTMGGPLLLLIFAPLVVEGRRGFDRRRSYMLLLVLVYSAYIIAVGGDHFRGERFFVVLVPWLALLLAEGIVLGFRRLVPPEAGDGSGQRPEGKEFIGADASSATFPIFGGLAGVVLGLGLIVFAGYALLRTVPEDYLLAGQDESVWIWRELGWWVADNAAPGESIAALGAGAIAYYSEHPVIDLLGLTERHIARVSVADMGGGTAGHEKRAPAYVLAVRRPNYIPRIWDDYFGGEAVLRADYELIDIKTRYGRTMQLWRRRP